MHYAHKVTTTKRALKETNCPQGLGLEQGAASHPADPHWLSFPLVKETHGISGQCVSLSVIDARSVLLACVAFLSFACLSLIFLCQRHNKLS